MRRKNQHIRDMSVEQLAQQVIIPDPSWSDPDDMWGIGMPLGVTENPESWVQFLKTPRYTSPRNHYLTLLEHNIKLSSNQKSGLCFSSIQRTTCAPSPWCREHCYGYGTRFMQASTQAVVNGNSETMKKLAREKDQSVFDEIADAIVGICTNFNMDGLRWNGIGDLVPAQIRLIDTITTRHPSFTVWGFTRKGSIC